MYQSTLEVLFSEVQNHTPWRDHHPLDIFRQGLMGDIESGRKQLSYPVHLDTDTFDSDGNFMIYFLASNLGGVTLSKDKSIMIGAEAINLNYFLDSTNEENEIR